MSLDLLDLLTKINTRLEQYDEKITTFEEKLSAHMDAEEEDRDHLKYLCDQVHRLNKIITQDNGQQSVLSKLTTLNVEVHTVKEDVKENREDVRELIKTVISQQPSGTSIVELRKARWLAVSKIVGLLALVAPGVFAFFSLL